MNIKKMFLAISGVLIILLFTGVSDIWSVPQKNIVYQGTLRKDGKVVTGNVNMEFKIVDQSGNEYWTSGSTVVYVNRGLFRYQIGIDNKPQFDSIVWDRITPYIRVKIIDENLTFPDEGFSWTPYALYADNIVGGALVDSTQTFTGINTFNNLVNINGNLNVGKSTISSEGWITLGTLISEPSPSQGRIYYSGSEKKLKISLDGTTYVNLATGTIKEELGPDVVYSTNIKNGEIKDEDVTLTTGAIKSGKFSDDRIGISTGGVISGLFGDDKVKISTNAITGKIETVNINAGDLPLNVNATSIKSGSYLNDVKVSSAIYADNAGISASLSGNINTNQINAGRLGSGVIASSIAVNSVEDGSIVSVSGTKVIGDIVGKASNINGNLLPTQIAAGGLPNNIYISSINSGNYLNDVKVSSAIYSDKAGTSASLSGKINTNQINAGGLPTNVYISSINSGSYLNDVKVSSAIYSDKAGTSTSLAGGSAGSIPYQTSENNTGMLPIGAPGQVLQSSGSLPSWITATNTNTIDSIVKRDSFGNFSAGTITASLIGNASTATKLATARSISLTSDVIGSASFDGSGDVSITATLKESGVAPGTYGSATQVSTFTVDSQGRITSAGNITISGVSPVGSSLNSGKIWLGNESNKAAEQSVTGDVTISSAGVVLIGNGKINSDKILDGTIVNADISDTAGIVYSKLSIEDGDLTIAKTNGLQAQLNSIATSTTTLQANIDGKVSKAGDTMTGGLTFNNVTGSVIGASGSTAGINISTNLYVSAGNVGIGTTSPGAKLEVNGDAKIGTNLTVVANTTLGTNSSNSLILNMGAVILNALNASNAKVDFKDSSSNTVVYFKKKP